MASRKATATVHFPGVGDKALSGGLVMAIGVNDDGMDSITASPSCSQMSFPRAMDAFFNAMDECAEIADEAEPSNAADMRMALAAVASRFAEQARKGAKYRPLFGTAEVGSGSSFVAEADEGERSGRKQPDEGGRSQGRDPLDPRSWKSWKGGL